MRKVFLPLKKAGQKIAVVGELAESKIGQDSSEGLERSFVLK